MKSYSVDEIRARVLPILSDFPVTKVTLFGSAAAGTANENSDIDLIVEFLDDISLLTLSKLKYMLEDALGCKVDLIHGPLRETDMIEIDKAVELYAA